MTGLMRTWIQARLNRKFLFFLGAELLLASLVFLVLFIGLYGHQLTQERAQASAQVNRLLQTALENAMLKRDLDGLRDIIYYLGKQDNIRRVSIINPDREVRFSSLPETVNDTMPPEPGGLTETHTRFLVDEFGNEVLRSINPVHNREPCNRCHGPIDQHPINGILIVDYDAASLRDSATSTALALIGSGALVVLAALGGIWWMLQRHILAPVQRLQAASLQLSSGNLDARVAPTGQDELSQLGQVFDSMAGHLQDSMERIRQQEAFLQTVIDTMPDGVRVIDQSYTIVKANGAYCRQIGRSMEEVIGARCHASSHGLDAPCPATLLTCPLAEIAKDGKPLKCVQQFRSAQGQDIPVEVHSAPLTLADGRLLIIEVVRDLGKEIDFSHQQKLSALGQLAAGVAHEIRNPLASVRLALQGTLRESEQGRFNADEVTTYLRLIDGQVDKCIDVTDRLLRLAINSGGERQLVSVNPAISDTLSLLAWEAQANNITLRLLLDEAEPRVLINDSELRMVVLNLAQNAFHAMPKGGTLEITSRQVDDQVELEFVDNGSGIAPDHLARIFDPFFSVRADGSSGTGLGLTICRSLLEHWGGGISAFSQPGQGARFVVRLPAADRGVE